MICGTADVRRWLNRHAFRGVLSCQSDLFGPMLRTPHRYLCVWTFDMQKRRMSPQLEILRLTFLRTITRRWLTAFQRMQDESVQ
jgi:hypothetical protein